MLKNFSEKILCEEAKFCPCGERLGELAVEKGWKYCYGHHLRLECIFCGAGIGETWRGTTARKWRGKRFCSLWCQKGYKKKLRNEENYLKLFNLKEKKPLIPENEPYDQDSEDILDSHHAEIEQIESYGIRAQAWRPLDHNKKIEDEETRETLEGLKRLAIKVNRKIAKLKKTLGGSTKSEFCKRATDLLLLIDKQGQIKEMQEFYLDSIYEKG